MISKLEKMDEVMRKVRKLLPIQNPLHAYVHNNILLQWEDRHFFDALEDAALLYQAYPYLKESYYSKLNQNDGIDLSSLVEAEKNEEVRQSAGKVKSVRTLKILRNHMFWETQYGELFSRKMEDLLVPLLANFLDQGLSYWQNPWKKEGFWNFFQNYCAYSYSNQDWFGTLRARIKKYENHTDLRSLLLLEYAATGLPEDEMEAYFLQLSFALRGWAGMIHKLEVEPDMSPVSSIPFPFIEYLAVKLICENALNEYLCQKHGVHLKAIYDGKKAFLFDFKKKRIWHEAFEITYRNRLVKDYQEFLNREPPIVRTGTQVFFCIDDREEAFRRHLEKVCPQVRTYGVVGFYGVDMKFFPLDRPKSSQQCPPVVTPQHEVYEVPIDRAERLDISLRIRSKLSFLALRLFYRSRTTVQGWVYSLLLGSLSFFPLFFRVLFPRGSKKVDRYLDDYLKSKSKTRYELQGKKGYSLPEMAKIVKAILTYSGSLVEKDFSSVIFIVGHGSTNQNNPFKQSYGCGACSGNPGFPNAKVFCLMANNPEVRLLLREQGLMIPSSVLFVAAYHDTCADEFFLDIPSGVKTEGQLKCIAKFETDMREACKRNAKERCKAFKDSHVAWNKELSLEHVRARSMDLAQPRPEYGHSRNAVTIVGRRELTVGFNFDRRAFQVNYNPSLDVDGALLEEIAVAAIPVCANISLDYYFSRIDNKGFGAGSKLPLNVASLIGVMKGSKSDLLIGLGRQMVELHEPLRHLVFIEAQQLHIERLLERSERLRNLVMNQWIFLGRIDPQTRALSFFKESKEWVLL